ncbi:hypothetical protein Vretimale_5343 [Volvox reticuliferus]|uniref:Uncharacterized protein n=1 Tax=Volvox reticuliferus TaxID=1737510 RepID=A0A8J4DDQ0_9CHLO|nr:hypothetical protein Vretifemale_3904 [Volvox reticuliferus]GIM00174.1 hypothetical protein Vretimale_5343 [Volvox reticuliferus]
MNTHMNSATAGILSQAAKTPRVIDVCDYVQSRETELRYLLHAVKEDVGEARFGASFLPRHLRRRATSHRRFVVRRRPNLRLAALHGGKIPGGDVPGVVVKRAQSRDAAMAEAALGAEDVGIREQLQRCILTVAATGPASTDGGTGTVNDPVQARPSTATTAAVRPTNREMRRRPARLQSAAEASCSRDLVSAATASDRNLDAVTMERETVRGLEADSELRRLETHVWHARRMAMERSWGHLLASHAVGRGRGSRSLLASLRRTGPRVRPGGPGGGVLLHDSSYLGCIELRGHQRCLADILRKISDPSRLDMLLDRPEVISGAAEWELFLHRPGAFPMDPLAPARALWLTPGSPDDGQEGEGEEEPSAAQTGSCRHTAGSVDIDAEGWATRCVLWLWVHAAAFRDAYEAVHSAAEVMMPPGAAAGAAASSGAVTGNGCNAVSIRSRCPDLRRIDVVGDTATACLARVLVPVRRTAAAGGPSAVVDSGAAAAAIGSSRTISAAEGVRGQPTGLGSAISTTAPNLCDTEDSNLGGRLWRSFMERSQGGTVSANPDSGQQAGGSTAANLNRFWRWPEGAVLGMEAADPRLAAPVRLGGGVVRADALSEAKLQYRSIGNAGSGGDDGVCELPCFGDEELPYLLRQWPEAGDWTAGAAMLWRPAVGPTVRPPLEQSKVASIRHAARKRLLRAGLGLDLRHMDVAAMGCGGSQLAAKLEETSRGGDGSGGGCAGVSFPVLLIRRPEGRTGRPEGHGHCSVGGWSLVLPARWVMPVWTALAFTGARPTGQSEWRQLATHFRTPCFPYDHPYTPAGMQHNREALAKMSDAASRRPMGRARKPRDLGPVADWTRLMQSPLQGRQLPSSLRGGPPGHVQKGAPKETDNGRAVDMDVGGEGGTSAVGPVLAGADAGGSAAALTSTSSMADISWALALSGSTLQRFLASGGDGYRNRPAIGMDAAQLSPFKERQHGQQQAQRGQRPVRGRQPANKDCLHGWSLRKALRLGLVAPKPPSADAANFPSQQEVPQEAEGQHVAMNIESGGVRARPVGAAGPGPQRCARCLVYAVVKVEGKGVCEAGAEIIGRYNTAQGSSSKKELQGDYQREEQREVVLGYVVSAATRGSPAYPGGLALCDAAGYASLALDADSYNPYRSGRLSGHIPSLRLWLRNPVSTALRVCRVEVLLPGDEIPQKPGTNQQLAWN